MQQTCSKLILIPLFSSSVDDLVIFYNSSLLHIHEQNTDWIVVAADDSLLILSHEHAYFFVPAPFDVAVNKQMLESLKPQ